MSDWRFIITKTATNDLDNLDETMRKRLFEKLKWFINNFDQVTPLPLGGRWKGCFKLRVGDWRIIYGVEDVQKTITIYLVDHRSKIYQR